MAKDLPGPAAAVDRQLHPPGRRPASIICSGQRMPSHPVPAATALPTTRVAAAGHLLHGQAPPLASGQVRAPLLGPSGHPVNVLPDRDKRRGVFQVAAKYSINGLQGLANEELVLGSAKWCLPVA